ncbi:MAG: exodeoxyribonuclease VII large subunit [Kofleriaceae bacterium]
MLDRLVALHPRARILARGAELAEIARRLLSAHPGGRLARARRDLEATTVRLHAATRRRLDAQRAELGQLGAQMAALSPLAVLDRGYAMVQHDGAILRDAAAVSAGDTLRVRLARGSVVVSVDEVDP